MSLEEKKYVSSFEIPAENGEDNIILYIDGADAVTEITATPSTLREIIENAKPNTIIYLEPTEGDEVYDLLTLTNEGHNNANLSNSINDAPMAVKYPKNLTIVGSTNITYDEDGNKIVELLSTIEGVSITSGLAKPINITNINPEMHVSSNLTFKNIKFNNSFCLRNCVIEGLNIIGCEIVTGNINISPDSLIDQYGKEATPSGSGTTVWQWQQSKPIIKNIIIKNNKINNANTKNMSGILINCVNNSTISDNTIVWANFNGVHVNGRENHYSTGKIAILNNIIEKTGSRSIRIASLKNAELYVNNNKLFKADQNESNSERIKVSSCTDTSYRWTCGSDGENLYEGVKLYVDKGITISEDTSTKWTEEKEVEIIQAVYDKIMNQFEPYLGAYTLITEDKDE